MPITKAEVLDVLDDWRIRNIRFSVGSIDINAFEYSQVADAIKVGAIDVEPGSKTYSLYIPKKNLIMTRSGDPPMDLNARTNLFHELTHAIPDINELKITRLLDEAAAYMAQFTYLLLLEPTTAEPPIGLPMNNMMRFGMKLVAKYKLGQPAGLGAKISPDDIASLTRLVHAIPDYGHIGEKDMLDADGVALSKNQKMHFLRLQHDRIANQLLDERMAEDVKQLLNPVRIVAYENYVTWDPELLELFNAFARGGSEQKKAAIQKLTRIFLTVDQRSASALLPRLSATRKGDIVSQRFQSAFPPTTKTALLSALKISR